MNNPFVSAYSAVAAPPDVTSFEFEPFRAALSDVMSGPDPVRDDEMGNNIADSNRLCLEFLDDAEAWTGSGEDYNAIEDLFHEDAEAVFPDITGSK